MSLKDELIEFVRSKPPEETYDWENYGSCALAQFFKHKWKYFPEGVYSEVLQSWYSDCANKALNEEPSFLWFSLDASLKPWTFGALYKRLVDADRT